MMSTGTSYVHQHRNMTDLRMVDHCCGPFYALDLGSPAQREYHLSISPQ